MSQSQAQGISHELMTLGLIVADPSLCTDVPGKAHPSHGVTELPPATQPQRSRCPRAVPTSEGDKGYLGRQSSAAKLCPESQEQHSPQTGTSAGMALLRKVPGHWEKFGATWGKHHHFNSRTKSLFPSETRSLSLPASLFPLQLPWFT